MSVATLPNTTLAATYEATTPGSAALAGKARALLPSGIAHDGRHFDPYPLYITRALRPTKGDGDGNPYGAYFRRHRALLPAHNNPLSMETVHAPPDLCSPYG